MTALMHHQQEGVAFLLAKGSGLIAFEQGLGKTLVAIETFRRLRETGDVDRLLVICPNSLKQTWLQELARHAPQLSGRHVAGSIRERRELYTTCASDVLVVNYESARQDVTAIRAYLSRYRAALVLDESHMVKNRQSRTATAAADFASLARYRWLLTGTPATNTPADIYSQIHLVTDGEPLGSFGYFMAVFGNDTQALARRIEPHLLRRTKEECLDLPDKTFIDVHVALPPWQRELYDQARDGLLRQVRSMSADEFREFAPNALTRLLRLSQLASNPRLVIPHEQRTPAKHVELDHVLRELIGANHRKVILWSYYVDTIRTLATRYAEYGVVTLFGETPAAERQAIAAEFQSATGPRLLVANPAAAGTGFTLTAASYTIYETLTWRYDLYAQSQDRNHRIGQTLPVTYLRLLAEDTIDTAILESLNRKAEVLGPQLLGDSEPSDLVRRMTPDAFCEMLTTNHLPSLHAN